MQAVGKNVCVLVKGATTTACNSSFVTTSEGIVLIDTPYLPTDAVKWREEIAKRGEVRYIINTEHHNDHTTGNFFFPGPVIAHQQTRAEFASSVGTAEDVRERFRNQLPEAIPLLRDYQPKPPSITFSERLTLYLGSHSFELTHQVHKKFGLEINK
jgi:cyclase